MAVRPITPSISHVSQCDSKHESKRRFNPLVRQVHSCQWAAMIRSPLHSCTVTVHLCKKAYSIHLELFLSSLALKTVHSLFLPVLYTGWRRGIHPGHVLGPLQVKLNLEYSINRNMHVFGLWEVHWSTQGKPMHAKRKLIADRSHKVLPRSFLLYCNGAIQLSNTEVYWSWLFTLILCILLYFLNREHNLPLEGHRRWNR